MTASKHDSKVADENLKAKIYIAIALLTWILLPGAVFSAGSLQSNATFSFVGAIQPPTETYSYTISVSGSNYILKNEATGQTEYQSTNPTQVFTNAFSKLPQGGSILTKTGTYSLPQTITANQINNIKWYFEDGATLYVNNGVNAPAITLLKSSNWLIKNPTINGNMLNQQDAKGNNGLGKALFGILINGGSNNLVDGATITNCGQFGVFISNPTYSSPAVNNGVVNSKISNCGWNAITIGVYQQPTTDTDDYIRNNTVHNCDDVGISTYGTRSLIENNTIYDGIPGTGHQLGWNNIGSAIQVEGGGNNTIQNNNISNCRIGIATNEPPFDYNTITHNNVNHCLDGIAIRSAHNTVTFNTITDYNFQNGWNTAISLLNSADNDINDNTMSTSNIANSIYLGSSNDNRVFRNTITANPSKPNTWSIWIETSSRNDIEQNQINGYNGIGIVDASSTGTVIRNNDLRSCTGTKISDSGTGTITEGNLLS